MDGYLDQLNYISYLDGSVDRYFDGWMAIRLKIILLVQYIQYKLAEPLSKLKLSLLQLQMKHSTTVTELKQMKEKVSRNSSMPSALV